MLIQRFWEHVLVSVAGWFLGVAIGGSLVYLTGRLLQGPLSRSVNFGRYLLLVPWRTAAVGVLEFFFFPIPILILFGFGPEYDISAVAGQVAALTILLASASFSPGLPRLPTRAGRLGTLRTLATLAVGLTTSAAHTATSGLGPVIMTNVNLARFYFAARVWLLTIGVSLVIDLVGGITQFVLWKGTSPQNETVPDAPQA